MDKERILLEKLQLERGFRKAILLIEGIDFKGNKELNDLEKGYYSGFFESINDSGFILVTNEKNRRYLDLLNKFNLKENQAIRYFGILLNIPQCCIDNYVKSMKDGNYYKKYFKNLKGKDVFNVGDGFSHSSLINFMPCSPDCKEAKKILLRNKKLLREIRNGNSRS